MSLFFVWTMVLCYSVCRYYGCFVALCDLSGSVLFVEVFLVVRSLVVVDTAFTAHFIHKLCT